MQTLSLNVGLHESLAVELAKLSLWLTTISKGYPFGFLDHNLKCGNSLLGITRQDQLTRLSMDSKNGEQERLFGREIEAVFWEAQQLREELRSIPIRDINDVKKMERIENDVAQRLTVTRVLADALVGIEIFEKTKSKKQLRFKELAGSADLLIGGNQQVLERVIRQSNQELSTDEPNNKKRNPFHWPLEFPEVFKASSCGFDAFDGNPPFLGGKKIKAAAGDAFRRYIVSEIANGGKVPLI